MIQQTVRITKTLLVLPVILTFFSVSGVRGNDQWLSLYNGKDLTGWHAEIAENWSGQNGVLVGKSPKSQAAHSLLFSDREFSDFEVQLKFRSIVGNSGFYFRVSETKSVVRVKGFQAEIDPTMATGGLYETAGRGWVAKTDHAKLKEVYKPGEWTTMSVLAVGKNVTVKVNDVVTAKLKDDPGRTTGKLALQLHGGNDMHVEFKDIRIREITSSGK